MENEKNDVYHHKNIVRIEQVGIEYTDSYGENHFINFNECKDNWVIYVNNSGQFSGGTNFKEEESLCVGWRDICGNPAFIEFFSNPRVKFIFPYEKTIIEKLTKTYCRKNYKEFTKMQLQIIECGWTTYDLS